MSQSRSNTWQAIQDTLRDRIQTRDWAPGHLIPHEADLAQEYDCARSTMNRALRGLAEEGLLERKRKAGTRVALNPVRQVRLEIPIIRKEIEGSGSTFRYIVLTRELTRPPPDVQARLQVDPEEQHLHLETLYTANHTPYMFENRWVNLNAVPQAREELFATLSPNEWLVREVPFVGGDFTFSAITADARTAEMLSCDIGQGLFVLDRTTRDPTCGITSVRMIFHPGYSLHTKI